MSTTGLTRVGISAARSSHSRSARQGVGAARPQASQWQRGWVGVDSDGPQQQLAQEVCCQSMPANCDAAACHTLSGHAPLHPPMSRVSRWSMSCMPASWELV